MLLFVMDQLSHIIIANKIPTALQFPTHTEKNAVGSLGSNCQKIKLLKSVQDSKSVETFLNLNFTDIEKQLKRKHTR